MLLSFKSKVLLIYSSEKNHVEKKPVFFPFGKHHFRDTSSLIVFFNYFMILFTL